VPASNADLPPPTQPPPAPPAVAARVTPPTPDWSRPDDATRLAQLNAMKRRATALLGAAGAVFAATLALEGRYPWLGWVRAASEASLVGGLADWFAVTALFRHPLGIPIPHTAILARRKDRIGRVLGNFVQNHFLSRAVIATNLTAARPAARAARWLGQPENARQIAKQMAGGLAKTLETLPDNEVRGLVRQLVNDRVRATRLAPALGKTFGVILAGDRRQELLSTAVRLAAEAIRDNAQLIHQQVRAETPWWVPGIVDDKIYKRILGAIERLLNRIGTDPYHPIRKAFDTAIGDFVQRLQTSPEMIAKAEALKEEFLKDPAMAELSGSLWETTRTAIVAYGTRTEGEGGGMGPLESGVAAFGTSVLANEALLAELDDMLVDLAATVVDRYRGEIGDLIADTVAGWDPEATSQRFELAVGRDLQYVRINGTLVGGLVGLFIYALTKLLR